MKTKLPTLFIGSSVEGLPYAEAMFSELERDTLPTLWTQDIFAPTKAILEELERLSVAFDFAVLIMTPDDITRKRGKKAPVPRDNLVFELGLFIGALGRTRVFFVQPRDEPIRLPTDVWGVTPLEYTSRSDNNFHAAVQTACSTLKARLRNNPRRRVSIDGSATDVKFWHTIKDREIQDLDVRGLIRSAKHHVILTGVSLHYIIRNCKQELADAVSRRTLVGFVISEKTNALVNFYNHYSASVRNNLPTAHSMYRSFYKSLASHEKSYFGMYCTKVPLTHSIGLYDGQAYINQFWIDHSSSVCPSFSPSKNSTTHHIIMSELEMLFKNSRCACGLPATKLAKLIKSYR